MRRTLREQVTVSLRLSPAPCQTTANPGDVDNAILNLAINARDTMFNGGTLTIETRNVTLGAEVAGRIANARPGEYVILTVTDTGRGMSPEVLKHAMEPLFTTKDPGNGTGLGLATVHATVRGSGGFLAIDSTVGEGTSVHLYFPKAKPATRFGRRPRTALISRLRRSRSEDRTPEAITLLQSREPVALVLSDIVMPGSMTGCDVAEWVRSMKPHLKVVLTSATSDLPLAVSEPGRKVKVLGKTLHAGTTSLRTPRSPRWRIACQLAEPIYSHENFRH